jgi:hypothetical protein
LVFYSFTGMNKTGITDVNSVVLQFITTNGYGNNLYIDNVSVGAQFMNDVAVMSINNIPKDTSYSFNGSSSFVLAPKVSFINLGRNNITSAFNVTLVVTPGSYTSTKQISSLASGISTEVTFDNLTITPNTGMNIKTYCSLSSDENRSNDTLTQYSLILPGVRRNVLFEAFTQTNCGPCAQNNPSLDAFITARFDTIVAIKHHVWWPGANNDPMYLYNVSQNNDRINYYSINAVPTLQVDGVIQQVSGYTTLSNLLNPYNTRLGKGSPLGLTVVDTRIAGDSVRANVTLTIYSPLSAGNYKLRVEAIERTITYSTPPGSNGETVFHDVFRKAFPNTTGTSIPTTPGTYNYTFTYWHDPVWVDSMIYTEVFVQNDNNKEVINSAKARHYTFDNNKQACNENNNMLKAVYNNLPGAMYPVLSNSGELDVIGGFLPEMFEGLFPPAAWSINNPDNGLTFQQYTGANGPTLGGTKSVKMPFYDYSATGQMDYMYTRIYQNVDPGDSIKFDWAYAVYPGYTDRLQVKVSTDGGTTYPYTIFDKSGADLATAASTSNSFVPQSASEWGKFAIKFGDITSIKKISENIPSAYELSQNYPNPFNPVTNISFSLPKNGDVVLKVYDIRGNEIRTYVNQFLNAGIYSIKIDGSNLASGVYFYRITAGSFTASKKMILVK